MAEQDPNFDILFRRLNVDRTAITMMDPTLFDSPIFFANTAFETLTGYDRVSIKGQSQRFLEGELTDDQAAYDLNDGIEREMETTRCLINYRVDGSVFHNFVYVAPVEMPNKRRFMVACHHHFDSRLVQEPIHGDLRKLRDLNDRFVEVRNANQVAHERALLLKARTKLLQINFWLRFERLHMAA